MTVLIVISALILTVSGAAVQEERINASTVIKDETIPATPWLSFLGLNPFQFLGSQQQAAKPNPAGIRATKTEYIEVTRRQTVHPVCYTMYENKAPCLPYKSSDDEEPEMDMDFQITHSSEIRKEVHPVSEMSSYMKPVKEVLEGERSGKYLKFVMPEISGSEGHSLPKEASTTTVLLTKLEKYTDHRVTATMVALNCFPVDPAIPRCRRSVVVNPIVDVPLHGGNKKGNKNSIIITPVVTLKSEEIDKTVEAVKRAAAAARADVEGQGTEEDVIGEE